MEGATDAGLDTITGGFEPESGLFKLEGFTPIPGRGLDPEPGFIPGTGLDPEFGFTTEGFPSGLFGGTLGCLVLGCLGGRLTVD